MKLKYNLYKYIAALFLPVLCSGLLNAQILSAEAAPAPLLKTNLSIGSQHVEVRLLQEYLNSHGFVLVETGPGSPGHETTKFGLFTKQALAKFQEAHAAEILAPQGLAHGTGNLYAATRNYINAHVGDVPTVAGASTAVPSFEDGVYAVGGTIHGVTSPVTLKNNAEILVVEPSAQAQFTFPTKLKPGQPYAVSVVTPPTGEQCFMRPGKTGAGVMAQSDVGDIEIQCTALTGWNPFIPLAIGPSEYTLSGTVSGLSGTVVLQKNGSGNLPVSANGSFTFPTSVATGSAYAVTVLTQPNQQLCTVTNGNGTMPGRNVANIAVSCVNTGPVVTSINPTNGASSGGSAVLITGSNFTDVIAVRFGATPAVSLFVINSTTISVTAPAGTGAVHITVTTAVGASPTSSADVFTYFTLEEAWAGPHWSGSYAYDVVRKEQFA